MNYVNVRHNFFLYKLLFYMLKKHYIESVLKIDDKNYYLSELERTNSYYEK